MTPPQTTLSASGARGAAWAGFSEEEKYKSRDLTVILVLTICRRTPLSLGRESQHDIII